ncbi:D-aminoacyl-tRNA deacylase [Pseudodesulfovibrio profundus]|uniref:D-aminoacyl-tRNA deacylase n=1 Tax=Pseudodesulfovibrio profundus TaxID=57320 RepID=A0A2C8F7L3_9BACT|nr:D-aminoacyl-tRNA deacylase [Pseudodesulfovibrio profundus]SOB58389.1 D-aminoacyl-tRNA deacylase [Pseudodesulfovibrio profundus]
MKLVIQRVSEATVAVEGETVGQIGTGFMVLVGFGQEDTMELAGSPVWKKLIDKLMNLRVFPDEQDKLNRSLTDIGGDIMLVSQFTLYADCRKGRRPSFTGACPPEPAEALFDRFVEDTRSVAPANVATGSFGAMMDISFTNWGPITIILDSNDF